MSGTSGDLVGKAPAPPPSPTRTATASVGPAMRNPLRTVRRSIGVSRAVMGPPLWSRAARRSNTDSSVGRRPDSRKALWDRQYDEQFGRRVWPQALPPGLLGPGSSETRQPRYARTRDASCLYCDSVNGLAAGQSRSAPP